MPDRLAAARPRGRRPLFLAGAFAALLVLVLVLPPVLLPVLDIEIPAGSDALRIYGQLVASLEERVGSTSPRPAGCPSAAPQQ